MCVSEAFRGLRKVGGGRRAAGRLVVGARWLNLGVFKMFLLELVVPFVVPFVVEFVIAATEIRVHRQVIPWCSTADLRNPRIGRRRCVRENPLYLLPS